MIFCERTTVPRQLCSLLCLPLFAVLGLKTIMAAKVMTHPVALTIDTNNEQQLSYLSQIIESLENLDILESQHTTCYSLDKIIKIQDPVDKDSWKISIDLHVQELGVVDDHLKTKSAVAENKKKDGCIVKNDFNGNYTTENASGLPNEDVSNYTGRPTLKTSVLHEESTLSLAQIMVISTCSTVIGLFFIVALSMRIRNYIKRKRELKHNRKTTTFHSSDLTMRGSHTLSQESNLNNTRSDKKGAGGVRHFPIDRIQWYEREYILSM